MRKMLEQMKEDRQFSSLTFDEMKFVEEKIAFTTRSLNLLLVVLNHPESNSFVQVCSQLKLVFK